jgi:hypothetical protein
MSFTPTVSRYHDALAAAMRPFQGRVLTTAEIREALVTARPDLRDVQDWVQPPDHCRNHTNEGACDCAQTARALFEQVERGRYRVL